MCAYNTRSPGLFWIAIVPESGATPEIFRSIEPRALITCRFVRERLQGFSRQRWRRGQRKGRGGGNFAVFRQGSFRLFWLQPPGCRYHHNFRRTPRRLPRCNQFRRHITPLRLSRRLQRLFATNQKSAASKLRHRSIHPIRRPAGKTCHSRYISRSRNRKRKLKFLEYWLNYQENLIR